MVARILLYLLTLQDVMFSVLSFSPSSSTPFFSKTFQSRRIHKNHQQRQNNQNDYIDAEFYPSNEDEPESSSSSSSESSQTTVTSRHTKKISPLQASLSSVEPKLSSLSINFVDPSLKSSTKQSFIPCRIAFTVNYDNVEYLLGTPVDTQVAMYVEDAKSNTAYFLDPDEDDNIEIMERAASIFEMKYEHISLSDEDDYDDDDYDDRHKKGQNDRLRIRFKRTPRTLTVEGDLSIITGNWKKDDRKEVETVKEIAKGILDEKTEEDSLNDDEFFDSFFTKELGSDYEAQALGNSALDDQVDEIMDLFNIPGLGTEQDDVDGIQDLIQEVMNDEKLAEEEGIGEKGAETALRLIGFNDENDEGKVYSLVQLLQPMILVAKSDPSLEFDERLLLTSEEADEIVPLLEKQFSEEFQEAGISLR